MLKYMMCVSSLFSLNLPVRAAAQQIQSVPSKLYFFLFSSLIVCSGDNIRREEPSTGQKRSRRLWMFKLSAFD